MTAAAFPSTFTGEGISAADVIMTQLHRRKFDQNSYKVSGGLPASASPWSLRVSSKLQLRVWRRRKEHFIEFAMATLWRRSKWSASQGKRPPR